MATPDDSIGDETEISSSFSGDSDYTSSGYEAEWADHINNDGSVLYIESYMSSTVREKQEQTFKSQPEKKTTFTTNEKQMKKQNRLLGLLKRRPSIRVKKSGDINIADEGGQKGNSEASPLKVTFRDNPSGEVRQVQLQITEHHTGLGRRASLCEVVLGVVPGRFSEPPDSRVMVAGLVPGSEALRSAVIKIGDWLKEVNGRSLTLDNFDIILQNIQIPSIVSVVVQKCASETLPQNDVQSAKRLVQTNLVKLISDPEMDSSSQVMNPKKLKDLPHTVLYLSLTGVSEHDPDGADIRYQFPNWSNKLVCVRGMFITIAHTVQEAVGNSALRSTVLIDDEYHHVAYYREENDVFLIALPHAYVSEHEIVSIMEKLSKLLVFEFGSISNAMTPVANKNYIDHLLSMMLGEILASPRQTNPLVINKEEMKNLYHPSLTTASCHSNSGPILQSPSLLLLGDSNVKLQIDNCLNELESGDFGDEDFDCDQCEMLYSIIGTCLFYKSHLIGSHVTGRELKSMWLFASLHGLLHLVSSEAVSQLVSWRPVYLPHSTPILPESITVKHYLLFVAMNHMLLGMLVESGNITELLEEMSGPDPVLVDQIETTLYQLHGLHIHNFCEESLFQGGIETLSIDENFKSSAFKKLLKQSFTENTEASKTPDVPSILKQRSSPLPELYVHPFSSSVGDHPGGEGGEVSDDTHSSLESPSSHNDHSLTDQESLESDWQLWKNKEGYNFEQGKSVSFAKSPVYPFSVTVGKEKVLFHLVHLDNGDGYIVETTPSSGSQHFPLYHQVAENFKVACAQIHHVLHASQRHKENPGNYASSGMMTSINEHGIMFSLKPSNISSNSKFNPQSSYYWVVGRLLGGPHQCEIYICYDDHIPQNIQEIAYKLSMNSCFG